MKRHFLIFLILIAGCVPPYKPVNIVDNTNNIDVPQIKASAAFDNYKKETAVNFRQLAKNCADGTYEYVSELVDAAVQLDKTAKTKRNKPIDNTISKELGDSKLDVEKAVKILNGIADDLDPSGKVSIQVDKKVSAVSPDWLSDVTNVTDFDYSVGAKALAQATEQLKVSKTINTTKMRKVVYCTQNELLQHCVNTINWTVDGDVYRHLINEHGFTQEQINGLNPRQCHILHSNAHNGIIKPTKIIME